MTLLQIVLRAGLGAALATMVAGCGEPARESGETTPAGQPVEKVTLNMASVFPTSLALLGENAPKLAENIRRASGGTLEIKVFEPGALVPGLETIPAVGKGSVAAAWSSPGFFAGTDSAFNIFTTLPFGPGIPEFVAWMYFGGGLEIQNELFGKHNIHAIPCGITPPEASGWFRKEINTVEDLKGLKMRFFGMGAKVMERLGVATQLLAPGDIFPALQLGTIDATEFANPSADEKLGFYQVAKYYYFPGWHQQASLNDFFINKQVWASLSDTHKAVIEQACGDMLRHIMAQGEATQWAAMKRMRDKHGVQIRRWPPQVLAAFEKTWNEVAAEEAAANPNFKRAYESYRQFRENYAIWREYGYLQ